MLDSVLIMAVGKNMGRRRPTYRHTNVTRTLIIFLWEFCRKEERKTRLQQTVSLRQTVLKDPTLMAQQKKLEEQQKEWQRLKQIKSNKAKTAEHTKVQAGTHNKVSTTIQNKDELTSLTK